MRTGNFTDLKARKRYRRYNCIMMGTEEGIVIDTEYVDKLSIPDGFREYVQDKDKLEGLFCGDEFEVKYHSLRLGCFCSVDCHQRGVATGKAKGPKEDPMRGSIHEYGEQLSTSPQMPDSASAIKLSASAMCFLMLGNL